MQIGKPVAGEQKRRYSSRHRYDAVIEAAAKLKDGEALPVTFNSYEEVMRALSSFRSSISRQRSGFGGLAVSKRGTTMYVWKESP